MRKYLKVLGTPKHLNIIGKRFRGKDGTIIEWQEHNGLIEISALNPGKGISIHLPFSDQFREMAQVTFEELIDKFDAKLLKRR